MCGWMCSWTLCLGEEEEKEKEEEEDDDDNDDVVGRHG